MLIGSSYFERDISMAVSDEISVLLYSHFEYVTLPSAD